MQRAREIRRPATIQYTQTIAAQTGAHLREKNRAFSLLLSYMCSRRSVLGAPFCVLCALVQTVLAERVVLLDDTFVAFENSTVSVEVIVPPFVLGGN